MEVKIDKCPYCQNTEYIIGNMGGASAVGVHIKGKFLLIPVKVQICTNCGSIVRSYVEHPEDLMKYKQKLRG